MNHIRIMTSIDVTQIQVGEFSSNCQNIIKYESERGFRAALPSTVSAALPGGVDAPPHRPAGDAKLHSLKLCAKLLPQSIHLTEGVLKSYLLKFRLNMHLTSLTLSTYIANKPRQGP